MLKVSLLCLLLYSRLHMHHFLQRRIQRSLQGGGGIQYSQSQFADTCTWACIWLPVVHLRKFRGFHGTPGTPPGSAPVLNESTSYIGCMLSMVLPVILLLTVFLCRLPFSMLCVGDMNDLHDFVTSLLLVVVTAGEDIQSKVWHTE